MKRESRTVGFSLFYLMILKTETHSYASREDIDRIFPM